MKKFKKFRECFDTALTELSILEELPLVTEKSPWADGMMDKIHSCEFHLRMLRMFFRSLYTFDDTVVDISKILSSVNIVFEAKKRMTRKLHVPSPPASERSGEMKVEYGLWLEDLQGRIQHYKRKTEESCELVLQYSLRCKSFNKKLTPKFMDAILQNLRDLYKFKTNDEIVLLKNQISTLKKKLTLLHYLLFLTPEKWSDFKEMDELEVDVNAFAQCSANLIFLYWVKEIDEEMATKLNHYLFNVMQKINPCDPAFKAFYIRLLKEIKLKHLEPLLLRHFIPMFLDLLLENLVDILKEDFQILHESLMFVIAFLVDPPDHPALDKEMMMITTEIEGLLKEDLYLLLSVNDVKGEGNFSKACACLSDIPRKIHIVKGKVQQVYDHIQDSFSFSYDFPKTNGLGFFAFLLQNLGYLKEKHKRDTDFIPFVKHLIIKIEEELMSMRPYLNDLFEQQKDQQELKDIWLKVIDLAYQTEYVINSCSVINHPLWYNMARLMEILDKIKVVNSKLEKIEVKKTHGDGILCSSAAPNIVLEDPWVSGFNEGMVGLTKEVDIIIEKLVHGPRFLDIVAIVGMAGLGKTTMAKNVYNAPTIRRHFHIFAYCVFSQFHDTKKIFLDILGDINGKDEKLYDMLEDDLADILRKCLKGKKYLIIIDDIWDCKAWDEIKRSLPNDQNGSRVIFTTRIRNVALQAKKDCIIHDLRLLSDEESWDLLKKKAFHAEGCPPAFSEVGEMIAKKCKGLPLTIVLIAGLLAKSERSLSWWNKIYEAIGSYASMEGCMDVIELSYQHLPDHLKPCFLYFGAFTEDKVIHVNKITLLWIAEGFVLNSNGKDLKNVAKEYLCDLVDRSLVISNERSSYGGIKSCQIHDLVFEFCQRKAEEENFFQFMKAEEASDSSRSIVHNSYRLCIDMKEGYISDATRICPNIHSIIGSCKHVTPYDFPNGSNMKLIQVICLEKLTRNKSFLKEIASSIHVRFISTSFPFKTGTKVLSSIFNLWNLEILILTRFNISAALQLPETIWNMTRLRHIDIGLCYICSLGVKKRESYPQLVNLKSFSSPYISSTNDLEDLLQRSPFLQKLSFHYNALQLPTYDFHFPKLDSLSKLESLKVFNVGKPCIRSFNILSTLKKLSLSNCYLHWKDLSTISKMPCLEVLKLLDHAFYGIEWNMEEIEFPKLKFLKLQSLNLVEWIAYGQSFPSLEVLIVNHCNDLNTIPPCFGELLTLKRIEIYESHKTADSVVEIEEKQRDYGNEELQVIVLRRWVP